MCCCLAREQSGVAIQKLHDAKQVLEQWKTSYLEMRAEIEETGSYSRWEFDRRRLFERTDYMALICQDLCHVLQVKLHACLWIKSPTTEHIDRYLTGGCLCFDSCCAGFGRVSKYLWSRPQGNHRRPKADRRGAVQSGRTAQAH